jgi:hypothetical protein
MAFGGRDAIISKMVISKKIIEQIHTYNYLGSLLSYGRENEVPNKTKFLSITVVISQVLKSSNVQKQTRL